METEIIEEVKNVPALRFPEFEGEWEVVDMIYLFPTITNGFVGTATPFYVESGVKYLQGKNIKENSISPNGLIFINQEFHNKQKKSQLSIGDLLMVQSGHVGECAVVTTEFVNANCHALLIAKPNNRPFSKFYSYFFYSPKGKKRIHKITTGNTIKHILASDLKNIEVPFPAFQEQQKVASFLLAVDDKIQQLTKKKSLLEKYKKGAMQQIFSQQIRFKDENGQEFPKWEEKTLGEVHKIYDGTHMTPKYVEEGIPFYSVEHVTADNFSNTKFISPEVFEKENKRVKLERGDILMTRIGDIGTSKYLSWDVKASFYVSLALIKQSKNSNSEYIDHYIKSAHFQKELHQRTIHVAFPKKINLGEIGNCIVKFPSIEEQNKIAIFLSSIDNKINLVSKHLEQTKQFKKGLLQQMFV